MAEDTLHYGTSYPGTATSSMGTRRLASHGLNRWSGTQARRWWAVRASHGWSRVQVRQAVRGCVLEGDAGAAARGVFDGLFSLVVEVVVLQAATGRSQGGEVGIQEH